MKSEYDQLIKEQIKKWRIADPLEPNLPLEWIKVFYKFKRMTRVTARYMIIMAEDLKDPNSKGLPTTYLHIKTHSTCEN